MCHPFVAGCRNGNGNPVAATRNTGVRILPVAPAADSCHPQAAKSTNYASHPRPISLSCRDFGKSSLSLSSLNYYSATNFNRSEHASANSTYIEISTKMSQTVVNHSCAFKYVHFSLRREKLTKKQFTSSNPRSFICKHENGNFYS